MIVYLKWYEASDQGLKTTGKTLFWFMTVRNTEDSSVRRTRAFLYALMPCAWARHTQDIFRIFPIDLPKKGLTYRLKKCITNQVNYGTGGSWVFLHGLEER